MLAVRVKPFRGASSSDLYLKGLIVSYRGHPTQAITNDTSGDQWIMTSSESLPEVHGTQPT